MARLLLTVALLVPLAGCAVAPPPIETLGHGRSDPAPVAEEVPPVAKEVEAAPEKPPPAPANVSEGLYRLLVRTPAGEANEASGFVVRIDGDTPVLFTALSGLGPEGGLASQLRPDELADVKIRVADGLASPATAAIFGKAAAPVAGLDIAPYQEASANGDVAAFVLQDAFEGPTLEFAERPPRLGAIVTLFAPLPNLPTPRTTAKVLGIDDGILMIEHETTDLDMLGAVGSPVVDADGKVVGVYVLGGLDAGVLYGVVTPVKSFRAAVLSAIQGG